MNIDICRKPLNTLHIRLQSTGFLRKTIPRNKDCCETFSNKSIHEISCVVNGESFAKSISCFFYNFTHPHSCSFLSLILLLIIIIIYFLMEIQKGSKVLFQFNLWLRHWRTDPEHWGRRKQLLKGSGWFFQLQACLRHTPHIFNRSEMQLTAC